MGPTLSRTTTSQEPTAEAHRSVSPPPPQKQISESSDSISYETYMARFQAYTWQLHEIIFDTLGSCHARSGSCSSRSGTHPDPSSGPSCAVESSSACTSPITDRRIQRRHSADELRRQERGDHPPTYATLPSALVALVCMYATPVHIFSAYPSFAYLSFPSCLSSSMSTSASEPLSSSATSASVTSGPSLARSATSGASLPTADSEGSASSQSPFQIPFFELDTLRSRVLTRLPFAPDDTPDLPFQLPRKRSGSKSWSRSKVEGPPRFSSFARLHSPFGAVEVGPLLKAGVPAALRRFSTMCDVALVSECLELVLACSRPSRPEHRQTAQILFVDECGHVMHPADAVFQHMRVIGNIGHFRTYAHDRDTPGGALLRTLPSTTHSDVAGRHLPMKREEIVTVIKLAHAALCRDTHGVGCHCTDAPEVDFGRSFHSFPDANLLSVAACTKLKHHLDQQLTSRPTSTRRGTLEGSAQDGDFQLAPTRTKLAELIGAAKVEELLSKFFSLYSNGRNHLATRQETLARLEIRLRRVQARGRSIEFHLDHSECTFQIPLNGDHEYQGGRLVFLTKAGVCCPLRPASSATAHDCSVVHGVTQMTAGVRYGLYFILLARTPLQPHEVSDQKLSRLYNTNYMYQLNA